ncbi:SspB family protein [Falsigemmobacter intermedius]|uniref:SspB family protein n=1 Tax=Falsigemmobacter intermedius TaxID=1553448 RepID=UPI003F090CAF
MVRSIEYGNLMHQAMRGLIRQVLTDVRQHGLPGEHHFFITFDTTHPDVQLADWLRARYPDEMTIVIQHWFENLEVDEEGFTITLNFGNQPEPMRIPFDALRTFVDPSVEFGLRFEAHEDEFDEEEENEEDGDDEPTPPPAAPSPGGAEVVQLNRFRKN